MKNIFLSLLASITLLHPLKAQTIHDTLYMAVDNNDQGYLNRLLNQGANVNYVKVLDDGTGTTPLITAVKKGNVDIIKVLIAHRVDVNLKDGSGNTALYYAALKGNKDAAKLLLENGARPENEQKVLAAAKQSGNKDLAAYIEKWLGQEK